MALRKEQLVLAGTVLLLGWMGWSSRGGSSVRGSSTGHATASELPEHVIPDASLALPATRPASDLPPRDLFAPPSDTRPLPPLALQPIPLAPLAMLSPPPEPGPMPSLYGRLLRIAPFTMNAPGLFAAEGGTDGGAAAADATPAPAPGGKAPEPTAEERALKISGYKKIYDWVRTVEFKFGEIKNANRYQLGRRPAEEVLFVEFNPETGKPRLPNQAPVPLSRTLVSEFGFADTVQNRVEERRAEFDDPLPATQYDAALEFADACIEQRLEAPRALEVAQEMYRRAMTARAEDPLPHLGLARCFEAGFEFEKAFQEYRTLLAGAHARDPLVLARLGELEARFRLFPEAEAHLLEAERYGRTQGAVQAAIGRFLLSRRRAAEAVEHLRLASQNEPSGAERKRERARLRADLGAALLGAGDVAGAAQWFENARQADPAEPAGLAGSLALAALSSAKPASDGGIAEAADLTGAGFDLILAAGIEALAHHDAASASRAKQCLQAAAAADPLRAHLAWRSLSFLAEVSGSAEDALRFAEQAVENDPGDPYALYQRGRILASRDDLDGAMDSFSRALEVELDFPDALAAMGEIQYRRGEFAAAERYLERALALDPKLAAVAALRGLNFLGLGSVGEAEKSFQAALALEKDQATAQNGLAWCRYLRGEVQEALTQLGEIDDHRRNLPETEPHRAWARAQLARIQDHIEKFAWTDRFERTDLMNGWMRDERAGPQVAIHDGMVTLSGAFNKQDGLARMWQERGASAFVSFEARLTIHADTQARVGIFVSRETERSGESTFEAEVTLSRNPEPGKNTIQTRVAKRGEEELDYTDVPGFEWKPETPVVVRIERTGESSDTRVRLLVDGFPVLDDKSVPNLGRTTNALRIGIFARGGVGRKVLVDMDDVEIVAREKK